MHHAGLLLVAVAAAPLLLGPAVRAACDARSAAPVDPLRRAAPLLRSAAGASAAGGSDPAATAGRTLAVLKGHAETNGGVGRGY
eukprot:COSAG01_NODE_5776_length_4039_cov_11.750761_3_plen_84_part_00